MDINPASTRIKIHRLTSTHFSKPQTGTQGSPRYQRSNFGGSWVANLQSIKTPQSTSRQIMDFDRLISLSAVQKVGSVPFEESEIVEQKRPLTDRQHHNNNSNVDIKVIEKLYSLEKRNEETMEEKESMKCCCGIFSKKVATPTSKIVQPPKRMKRPNLNELKVEKRNIKIVTSRQFNERRKTEDGLYTPTDFSSPKSNYRYY